MPLNKGDFLENRYRIDRKLGQGGFGAVYLAQDERLGVACAIKESFDTSEAAIRQFKREASMLAALRHPNLPRVTDYFDLKEKGLYLVMDFIEGEDLGKKVRINGSGFSEAQAMPWIRQIIETLDYLHSQDPSIIHRDIKPQNIIITKQNMAVLVDFGLAKTFDRTLQTASGAWGGTPGFSAIEQYGQGVTDQRSDIYSLGATIYYLLTGQIPPDAVQRVSDDVRLNKMHNLNPTVSSQLEEAVRKALEINPTKRLQKVREPIDIFSLDEELEGYNATSSEKIVGRKEKAKSSARIQNTKPTRLIGSSTKIPAWKLSYAIAQIDKGIGLLDQSQYEDAIECFDQALYGEPKNTIALSSKGSCLSCLDRYEDAIECFDQVLALEPNSTSALNCKGSCLSSLDRYEDAIECFDQALALEPKNTSALIAKGNCLSSLDRKEEAIECFDQVLALEPKNTIALFCKGNSLITFGRYEEAIECYDQALETDHNFTDAWLFKGLSEEKLSKWREATLSFQKYLTLAPENDEREYARKRIQEMKKMEVD